jgi:UDP-2,3-diacylglucosamine pyrophosphatase LpxH
MDEKFRLGLLSDLHFGASSMCKPALKYDLDRMAEAECRIAINGDVFDFILPSDMKRFDLDALDRELLQQGVKPIDAAIEMA